MGTIAASTAGLHPAESGPLRARLEARLRRRQLDEALIAGADPDSTPALAVRAEQLVRTGSRASLARSVRDAVNLAVPPRQASSRAPLNRPAIRASRAELLELARLLEARTDASAAGVALVRNLIADGTGPLYGRAPAVRLRGSIERASRAISGGGR
jgi:hypothetical protein